MNPRILLRGGLVADGIGDTAVPADVLIERETIAAVGAVSTSPGECQVIDLAAGSVVCPGFIDAHAHAEGPLLASGRVDGALAQGVTTLVVGQDGESWVGATAATTEASLGVGGHLDRPTFAEDDMAWLCLHDRHCAGSDGIYQGQHPHPRGYSAFAALAGYYLTEGPGTGYQRLARHLAANAADVYGLRDRGRLRAGLAADICVIAPGGLTARATYDAPLELATGADLVLVNGAIAWQHGQPGTAPLAGRLVS